VQQVQFNSAQSVTKEAIVLFELQNDTVLFNSFEYSHNPVRADRALNEAGMVPVSLLRLIDKLVIAVKASNDDGIVPLN
jgi:hypothetical protein